MSSSEMRRAKRHQRAEDRLADLLDDLRTLIHNTYTYEDAMRLARAILEKHAAS